MKGLTALSQATSRVLGVAEKTVRSRIMLLRKEGLWSSAGHGVTANPVPADATNLLLSFLGGGLVTKVAETVRLVRYCEHIRDSDQASLPPVNLFAGLNLRHTLGEMLDSLFENWSDRGPISDAGDAIAAVGIRIERYGPHGWEAEMFLRSSSGDIWDLHYEFLGPRGRIAVPFPDDKPGDLITSARVGEETFAAMAECLHTARGQNE
jgi:hypothetical protein